MDELKTKKLTLNDVFEKINSAKISITGAAQVIVKIINQYRYDLTQQNITAIKKLKIFPVNNKFMIADEITSLNQVNNEWVQFVYNNSEKTDIKNFFNKIDIKFDFIQNEVNQTDENSNQIPSLNSIISNEQTSLENKQAKNIEMIFKHSPNIKKWRSAETNVKEYLESLQGVLSVNDVSKANMGYDLEVMFLNTRRIYVEVKSVTSFKEPISITNNEYSSAHNYGKAYYIAVVLNDETIDIKFINDPINTLKLEKRIERWSWISDSYVDKLTDVKHILQ